MRKSFSSSLILSLFVLLMCVPFLLTFVYSISTEWGKSILPTGLTLQWYEQLYADPRFIQSVVRSCLLTFGTLIAVLIIVVPSIVMISIYLPKAEKFMKPTVLMPYAIPGVVLATGLLRTYSGSPVPLTAVLSGGIFIYALPFMYQSIHNNLREVDAKTLMEASEILGASKLQAFVRLLLPNIKIGIMVGSLLTFSTFLGEFQITNMLLGGDFETIRIYMLRVMKINGHLSSAVVVTYFLLLLMISAVIVKATSRKSYKLMAGQEETTLSISEMKGSASNELLND
ncbi:ABC transporter permease [Sporolactobacillus putidus]|uniref:ABC transporter permease n=1 Tax=Sporolactobacillus putidus TaxID=492735 RepID=A0A917S0K1_9BACL|nr:ABC transporter permease subunit [Sporolactobacillus putidus]GGL49028.1 ABC transporter permease [Sporolactobacillus putidus]